MIDKKEAPLLDDYIFKRTFTRDNPNGILRDFLEAVLNIQIRNVQVLNSKIPKDLIEEKGNVLDIRAELDNKKIVDIEMQVKNYGNIDKRSVTYMSKNISTQLKISEEYVDLGYKKEDEVATDVLEMHFIELPKFIKKNPEAKTKLEQWLWLIAGKEEKLKMSKLDNPEVKKAMKLVEEIMSDPKEKEIYEARKMAKFNYDSGIAYAKEEGKKEERTKNAKKMKEMHIPDNQICQILNITQQELNNIIKE